MAAMVYAKTAGLNHITLTAKLLACAAKTANSMQKKQHQAFISQVCVDLARDILNGHYQPGSYTRFAVTDPKLREIYAPSFRDRLVQCWVAYYAEPLIERHLIEDTFANRKGKGALCAIKRAQHFMRKPQHPYYLQLDIQAFFNSIHRPTLNHLWQTYLAKFNSAVNPLLADLSGQIILQSVATCPHLLSGSKRLLQQIPQHKQLAHAGCDCGLPIGSVTSQLFANFYLSQLDQFIKHRLKVKGYCRYMDDFVLFADNPQTLIAWQGQIADYLATKLQLKLHPTKQHLQRCKQGLTFLGYVIYPHYLYLKRRNINKLLAYLRFFNQLLAGQISQPPQSDKLYWLQAKQAFALQQTKLTQIDFLLPYLQQMQALINSYLALLRHGQHFKLRKHITLHKLGLLSHYFLPNGADYTSLRLKAWVTLQRAPL